MMPSLPDLVASVLAHASRDEGVLGGDRALLYALDDKDGTVQGGTRFLEHPDLAQAVVEGKLLLALSETPRTALCYLSVLHGPRETVGLQVDCRAEGAAVASFGAPLGVDKDRPALAGELWGLNEAAREALAG